jgi:5'-phosphate synthase pdxT subunit
MMANHCVGILALQGDFARHQSWLEQSGLATREVKHRQDLSGLDALVLPGGESTTMLRLIKERELWQPLDDQVRHGLPILATCAGTILVAAKVSHPDQASFGWVPMQVERNAYGDQRHSHVRQGAIGGRSLELVFIRAPKIVAWQPEVTSLIGLESGGAALVQYKNILAATFHPELCASAEDALWFYRFWRTASGLL